MPAPANLTDFVALVRKSGLITDDRLNPVLNRVKGAAAPPTIDAFAQILVRDGLLTFFQAKQLKLGRYKRFTIGSKYRLLELLGAGGMGAVYLCEHTIMKRLVALKVLPVEKLEDPSSLDRFHREARAVAALDHPNIVRAHDIDQYDKLHFLVMEFVDGASLQEVVARQGPMDPVRAAHYIAQSAIGMQHAHELGMVHRDIKPGNLLLDRTGVVKILDMGLARFFNKQSDNVTEKYDEKCVLGTADYLAPEQAVSNQVDVRADIYSLGGTFYFLLTGQTPFPDGTIASKLVSHQKKEPKPVTEFRKDVPPGLLAVLRKMMAKKAEDRYQEPIEVADALAEWVDQPIGPPPAKEMPALCPAVMALTGHGMDKLERTGAQTPLARAVFGAARGGPRTPPVARARPSGPSSVDPGRKPRRGPESDVGVGGPVSTVRASVAPTAPLDYGSGSAVEVAAGSGAVVGPSVVAPVSHARIGLWVALGLLAGLLFAGAAVAVYFAVSPPRKASAADPPAVVRPAARS